VSKTLKDDIQKFVKDAVRKRLAKGLADSNEAKSTVSEIIELLSYLQQSVPPAENTDVAVEEIEGELDDENEE